MLQRAGQQALRYGVGAILCALCILVVAGCTAPAGSLPDTTLTIVHALGVFGTEEDQPKPTTETRSVHEGDVIEFEGLGTAQVTIAEIADSGVSLHFETSGVVSVYGDTPDEYNVYGEHRWTFLLAYGEEYPLMTQTEDATDTWILSFSK